MEPTPNYINRVWRFVIPHRRDYNKILSDIEFLFKDYSYFPETDWPIYGYSPPEPYQVLGAWRHLENKVFVFLLQEYESFNENYLESYLLLIVGEKNEIESISAGVIDIQDNIHSKITKLLSDKELNIRLERSRIRRPMTKVIGMMSILTGIINIFSLYLRKIPEPFFSSQRYSDIYHFVIESVHLSAVTLLLSFIIFVFIYLIKYSYLIIRDL